MKIFTKQEKIKTRMKTKALIKKGILVKPEFCEICKVNNRYIQAHHIDYSVADIILFICRSCHDSLHRAENTKKEDYKYLLDFDKLEKYYISLLKILIIKVKAKRDKRMEYLEDNLEFTKRLNKILLEKLMS